MAYKDEEEYEFSECADDAICMLYPDWLNPSHQLFERYMIELQLALLRCHVPLMDPASRRRALGTVQGLKRKLSMWGVSAPTQTN